MSSKKYKPSTAMRTARPRSARLRDLGGMGYPSSSPILVRTVDGNISEEKLLELQQLLDWFEYDPTNNMLQSKYGLYSYGPIVAGGKVNGLQVSRITKLSELKDVQLESLQGAQTLVFDAVDGVWKNKAGGSGGSATLENDIIADVTVGNIKKGATLAVGMTITDVLTMMFSQSIVNVLPTARLTNTPVACEVGSTIQVNPGYVYSDGYYKTPDGVVSAECEVQSTTYYLDDNEIETPYELVTADAKQYKLGVKVSYGESQASVKNSSGDDYTDKIKAGIATADGVFNVCYKWFWGFAEKKKDITSEIVRNLEYSDFILPTSNKSLLTTETITTPGGKDIVIAIPVEYKLTNALDGQMGSSVVKAFAEEGQIDFHCEGGVMHSYTIYKWTTKSPYDGSIKNIEIEKAQ